jgi:DNA (cytosine-5)-methyltransferase 1
LQGLPEWFDFVGQNNAASYKQLGNGVNVGVVYNVLKAQVLRDVDLLAGKPGLLRSIIDSPDNPDEVLNDYARVHNSYSDNALFEINATVKQKEVTKKETKSA